MKLVEALRIANAPQEGPEFAVLLACGFTPLHLETIIKAQLRLRFPGRTITIQTGLYGDLPGALEKSHARINAVLLPLEWADLDPRLGWRGEGPFAPGSVAAEVGGRLDRIATALRGLAQNCPIALSLPTVPLPPVFYTETHQLGSLEAQLREALYRFAASIPAIVIHPSHLPVSGHDLRAELSTGFPYSLIFASKLADALVTAAFPLPAKKAVITDLDETLWAGVLGDDGPYGVTWDLDHKTHFHALYQALLNSLSEAGVLIAIASKNDETLVRQAFERPDLIASSQRFFPIEAHWNLKTGSIARILDAWNINADSVVFIDDNALEIEQVKTVFPEMDCILFRRDDPSFLCEVRDRFATREIREEDSLRAESLRNGLEFRRGVTTANTLDGLLASAEAKMIFRWGKEPLDPRALELINKTNQFNLNGARYTPAEWKEFLDDPKSRLLIVEYQDRFGKLGKIAVVAGQEREDAFSIESWVMSCRAFSRRIEHQTLVALLDRWHTIEFRFERTTRNGPLQEFFATLGVDSVLNRSHFQERCPPLFHQTEFLNA